MSLNLRTYLASSLLATSALLGACATDDTQATTADKDQYRDGSGKSDSGDDVCAEYGWYGDGECDAFCAQRDPDCATDARTPELANAKDALASKITMAAAAKQVEAAMGTVIECKFEPDDSGKLSLSLYPVGKAVSVDAKNNLFQEASGDPTGAAFAPGLDVFHDFEHLAVSTRDLTLVQLSQLSVRDAITQGAGLGFVYWAIPTMQNGRAGYGVYGVSHAGESNYAFIDGRGSRKRQTANLGTGPTSPTDDRVVELGADITVVKQSKITMLDAIDKAEAIKGKIVEAKFELGDDGKLSLSIYPAGKGASMDPSRNVFQEMSGDPTTAPFAGKLDVFADADREHLVRSTRDLTLVQLSKFSLEDAVSQVSKTGAVYWAIPTIKKGRAGYGVYSSANGTLRYDFIDGGGSTDSTAAKLSEIGAAPGAGATDARTPEQRSSRAPLMSWPEQARSRTPRRIRTGGRSVRTFRADDRVRAKERTDHEPD